MVPTDKFLPDTFNLLFLERHVLSFLFKFCVIISINSRAFLHFVHFNLRMVIRKFTRKLLRTTNSPIAALRKQVLYISDKSEIALTHFLGRASKTSRRNENSLIVTITRIYGNKTACISKQKPPALVIIKTGHQTSIDDSN